MIPAPLTDERLLLALACCWHSMIISTPMLQHWGQSQDGYKIFGCTKVFDHAAKQNLSKYPWAQNIVEVGLLKIVKNRWACLPLSFRFYHLKKSIEPINRQDHRRSVVFESNLEQAVHLPQHLPEIRRQ